VGRWGNKVVIGLTGNIATGKSLVRRMLDHLGAYTIDADAIAHQAMAPGAPAYKPIVLTFGQWILDADRRIDRARLGAVVFAHPLALARLEAISHPVVTRAVEALIRRSTRRVVVVEAIKLIESDLIHTIDALWVVDAREATQIERLARRGLSREEALKRIRVQNPQADKVARADVVIRNDGTPEQTWAQVKRAWAQVQGAAEAEAQADAPRRVVVKGAAQPAGGEPTLRAVDIVRGTPRNAEQVAALMQRRSGQRLSRDEVLMAFGQRSYLMAMVEQRPIGLIGFLVENLVTRVDEFLVVERVPVKPVAAALIDAVERASKDLQSEVGYIFLREQEQPELVQACLAQGYEAQRLEEIRIPAWREAVREARPDGAIILGKKLRAERVLKPL